MNVLVVGGAGYVGGGIVDKLKENHNVTVFDSLIYEESYRKDVNFVYGDIRDKDKLLSVLNKNKSVPNNPLKLFPNIKPNPKTLFFLLNFL